MKKLLFTLIAVALALVSNTTKADYYLIGGFNDWTQSDQACKFTQGTNGQYILDLEIPLTSGFKINDGSWNNDNNNFGGNGSTNLVLNTTFNITVGGNSSDIKFVNDNLAVLNAHLVFNPTAKTLLITGSEVEATTIYGIHGNIFGNTDWSTEEMIESEGKWILKNKTINSGSFGIKAMNSVTKKQTGWFAAADSPSVELGKDIKCTDSNYQNFSIAEGTYTFTFDPENSILIVTGNQTGETPPEWIGSYVNLLYENNGWKDNGVQLNDADNPVATFSNLNIGDKGFRVKTYKGSDINYSNGQRLIFTDGKYSGILTPNQESMYVQGASSDATFDVTFNIDTKEITLELVSGLIEETSRDKVLYVVGEATNWLENKVQMDHVEGTNVWTLTSSEVFGQPWKICDGTWNWNFGMGDKFIKDVENDAWFNSQSNFSAISGEVTVTFTLIGGSDYDQSSTASKVKFTTEGDVKKTTYLKGVFNNWNDNYADYIDEDNKVATWDKVQLFAVAEGANKEQKGQIKIHSFDGWFGSNDPVKLNAWTPCYEGQDNFVIEDDSANENKLYLVKFNTESHEIWVEAYDFYLIFEDGELNRSYKFQDEGDNRLILSVASIPEGKKFYIGNGGTLNYTIDTEPMDYENQEGLELKPFTDDNYSLFESSVINVNFYLSMDYETLRPFTVEWESTKSEDVEDITISFGNDKTMQSGKLSNSDGLDGHIHIDIVDTNTGALIFVHSPKDENNTPLTVYHQITMGGAQNVNRRAAAPEGYTKATFNEDYQAHQVALPEGTGTVSLDYEGNPDEAKTYSFEVVKSTPLGVDGIEAEEGEAEYFTLQGVKLNNAPEKGIYIKVVGGKAVKVVR